MIFLTFNEHTHIVDTRKIRFINVSSSSGRAMRTRADNPIAIHHQAGRYTTIASLSLIIFFPLRFFVFVRKPRTSRLFTVLASSCTHPEWLPIGERRTGCYHLSSAIAADRHCQQNRDALLVFPVEICRQRESDATETRGIKKSLREKNSTWRKREGERGDKRVFDEQVPSLKEEIMSSGSVRGG